MSERLIVSEEVKDAAEAVADERDISTKAAVTLIFREAGHI